MYNLLATTGGAIVDLVIILVLVGFIALGYFQGFGKTVISLVGNILSLILATVLCVKFVELMNNAFGMVDGLSKSIESFLPKVFGEKLMSTSLETLKTNQELIDKSGLSSFVIKIILDLIADSTGIDPNVTFGQLLAPTFSYYVAVVIGYVVMYILFRILFFLLGKFIESMYEFELFEKTDRALGACLGFLQGILILQVVTFIIGALPFGFMKPLNDAIVSGTLSGLIGKINLMDLLSKALNSVNYIKKLIISSTSPTALIGGLII